MAEGVRVWIIGGLWQRIDEKASRTMVPVRLGWAGRRHAPSGRIAFLTGCRLDAESVPSTVVVGRTHKVLSSLPPTGGADWAGASGLSFSGHGAGRARGEPAVQTAVSESGMELTWYGRTCVRLRGRDAVVVADPYQSVVGPTGRGITGDIVTYQPPRRHAAAASEGQAVARRPDRSCRPASTTPSSSMDRASTRSRTSSSPACRTYRDDAKGAERGQAGRVRGRARRPPHIHLGDIGHLLSEEKLGDIGSVDIACVPLGGALTADACRGAHRAAGSAGSSSRCRSARTRPTAPRRSRSSSTRWAASRRPSRSCR